MEIPSKFILFWTPSLVVGKEGYYAQFGSESKKLILPNTWHRAADQAGGRPLPHHQHLLRLGGDDGPGPDLHRVVELGQLVGGYVARVDLRGDTCQSLDTHRLGYNNRLMEIFCY